MTASKPGFFRTRWPIRSLVLSGCTVLTLVLVLLGGRWSVRPVNAQNIGRQDVADQRRPLRSPRGVAPEPDPNVVALAETLVGEMIGPQLTIDLDPDRSIIWRMKKRISRVSVTNPSIVELTEFDPLNVELIPGSTGETCMTLWFEDGDMLRYLVRVSPNQATEDRLAIEYGDLERKINEFFPGSMVRLIPIADKLIVKGQARNAEEATQIMSLIRGDMVGDGTAATSSFSVTPYSVSRDLASSGVISLLEITGEMQVMLKVRVAELSRSGLRQMGADLNLNFSDFTFSSTLGITGAFSAVLDTDEFRLMFQALSSNSYSKILAEPNLVTLSGHSASFIAGGEFAVPVVVGVEGAAAATTNFRGFGTQLFFLPTVLDKDRIRLEVSSSFSALNQENSVEGIPGLDTRAVSTTVDLREGQWLAIAGLIQDEQTGSKARIPFVGDVPVLDSIFSRKSVKRDETELLVLVSPELVHALEAEEAPLILPGMEVTEPGDLAFFAAGYYEGMPGCQHRSTVWPVLQRQILEARREAKRETHYQRSEGYYIQGGSGFSQ